MAIQGPHFLGSMTLKALLEDPNLKNPPLIAQSSDHLKIKTENKLTDQPQYGNYKSAFLGPNLWDKTYDNFDFNLEYMDLDEFLSENVVVPREETNKEQTTSVKDELSVVVNNGSLAPPSTSPRMYLRTPPISPSQFLVAGQASPSHYAPVMPSHSQQSSPSNSNSPSPPNSPPLSVDFHVSEQDLALTSIPDYYDGYQPKWQSLSAEERLKANNGHDEFDPRKRNFSAEELKPQPILKKSRKIFVPEDLKDDKYWHRRHKNNYAAKRSRDARRIKENQIAMRASFLEKENNALKDECIKLRKENAKLKTTVSKYESN